MASATDEEQTVFELLEHAAAKWPGDAGLVFEDATFTWSETREASLDAAARLAGLGVRRGDVVAVWSANNPAWIALEFGLARLGAVLVTVNTSFGVEDLAYVLRHSGAKVLCTGREAKGHDLLGVLRALDRTALPDLRSVVLLEGGALEGALPFEDLACDRSTIPHERPAIDDCINMQYTSGTTGFPKAVMLSSRNLVGNARRTAGHAALTEDDRVLCHVPLFHCFGCVVAVLASTCAGARICLTRVFDPSDSLRVIRRHGVTVVHGVPAMFRALLDADDPAAPPIRTVRTGIMAGAPCPPSLVRRVLDTWRAVGIAPGFGLTEASPAVTYMPFEANDEQRCTTVGIPLDGTEIRLVDPETGRVGDAGEIQVRGDQVMLGYFRDEKATRAAITEDGWLATGDLGDRRSDGYYRVVGRIKEMICRGGENVYPAEVEEAVRSHPDVADAAAFGVPDDKLGETVACAVIPVAAASAPDRAAIAEYLAGRVAKVKVPAYVYVVDTLPMTASGKIQRYRLTERFGRIDATDPRSVVRDAE